LLFNKLERHKTTDPVRANKPVKTGRQAKSPLLQKRFRLSEFIAEGLIKIVATASFAVILLIFIFVFREASPIIFPQAETQAAASDNMQQETYGEESGSQAEPGTSLGDGREQAKTAETSGAEGKATIGNLAGSQWQPVSKNPRYGLLPLIVGSFKVTLIAVLFGAPVAILSAIFTSFFAPRRFRELLKPAIEFLSGFPSVVIGFFALVELASLLQNIFGYQYRLNAFVGGIALSLSAIPIIYSVTEDALSAVPRYMTEASLALGATKWQTALFVVLPAATPGVFAAFLLGTGRAFGETMIVLMATGNAALMSWSAFEPIRTMSATIGAEMAEVVFGDTHYNVLFMIGAILFVFTFALNAVAEFYVRNRLQKRFRGA
jgi:phosphate transport system permease protein